MIRRSRAHRFAGLFAAAAALPLAGAVLFISAALLSAPGGWDNVEYTFDRLVGEPYHDTFETPLGAFD